MKFTFASHSEIYFMLKALNETHSAIEKGQVGMVNDESREGFDSLRNKFQEFVLANMWLYLLNISPILVDIFIALLN